MAVFAKMKDNVIAECIMVDDINCDNKQFPLSEPIGQAYLASLGLTGLYLQTSPDGLYRGCYAGMEWTYDVVNDVFVPPMRPTIPTEQP